MRIREREGVMRRSHETYLVEVVKLLRRDNTVHELAALEVLAGTDAHGNDIQITIKWSALDC
jgi:hypothetical protein